MTRAMRRADLPHAIPKTVGGQKSVGRRRQLWKMPDLCAIRELAVVGCHSQTSQTWTHPSELAWTSMDDRQRF